MLLLSGIEIRSQQCFDTSIIEDSDVNDNFLTLHNKSSTWLRPFSSTYYSTFNYDKSWNHHGMSNNLAIYLNKGTTLGS